MMVCVTRGRVSSIYSALRSVQQVASVVTGKAVMLSVHAKGGLQTLLGEAGRPPLGRPAWGLRHLAPTFSGWLRSSPRVGCELLGIFHVLPRPADLT